MHATKADGSIGLSYDWSREVNSSSPEYYRWTQWFFLLLHKHGLAYRSFAPANWCPSCSTVLANEEVEHGGCWRCGSEIEKKDLPQWFFKITDYAERLLNDLDTVDWRVRQMMQRNRIGRAPVLSSICPSRNDAKMRVFTTRA